jgi:hypothetical protein
MDKAWAGVDASKEFHWAHLLDVSGRQLLSRKVENDEADILRLIDETLSFAEEVHWAVDQPGGGAASIQASYTGLSTGRIKIGDVESVPLALNSPTDDAS